jgi:DtxR family Mn-dependent transcriptional regulator
MVNPGITLLFSLLLLAAAGLLFWPGTGFYWRWQQTRQLTDRVLREDALKHIHKFEMAGNDPTCESIAGVLGVSLNDTTPLIAGMEEDHLVVTQGSSVRLTPDGRDAALHIIRAHRLWERHLADETGYTAVDWHGQAEQQEHRLTSAELDALALRLGNPTHDPHGDPIPTAAGEVVEHGGQPLNDFPIDTPGRIVHLEDEPHIVYAQLLAEGLHLGMPIRITEVTPTRIRFWANGNEHNLAPALAANISVAHVPPVENGHVAGERLSTLQPGETAVVTRISPRSRGAEKRRFMDLGILKGTQITAEIRSPGGDPTGYRIRDAVIALRKEQADQIYISKESQPA